MSLLFVCAVCYAGLCMDYVGEQGFLFFFIFLFFMTVLMVMQHLIIICNVVMRNAM